MDKVFTLDKTKLQDIKFVRDHVLRFYQNPDDYGNAKQTDCDKQGGFEIVGKVLGYGVYQTVDADGDACSAKRQNCNCKGEHYGREPIFEDFESVGFLFHKAIIAHEKAKSKRRKFFLCFLVEIFALSLAKQNCGEYNKGIMEKVKETEEEIVERERKQFVKMTQTSMPKLIISLGIPTMLSMMVTSLYNLADTAFVSTLGDPAIAAVGNLLALMSIIQAIGFTYGMGSGAIVSRLLGKRDREGADKIASSAFAIALVNGLIITLFGFIFMTPLLKLLSSNDNALTMQYSRQYAFYILLSAPIMCMSFVMNNVLRAEGKAVLSMIGLVVGAVINVALDPILIFVFGMGVRGAAIATFASQCISFLVLLFMFLARKTIVQLRLKAVSLKFRAYGDIIATGFPSFCRQILASLCTVFLNRAAATYGMLAFPELGKGGKDAAQSALGVVQKMFMLAFSISLGIGQGYQPVLGYNYSAKRFDRVRSAYLFTLAFSTGLMVVFALVCGIGAPLIMKLFSLSPEAIEVGTITLICQCIAMPLLPVNFMSGLTYQVVGNKAIAALLSISRQGLFYIPAVLLLPKLFAIWNIGILGVEICQAVSDVFAFLFALPFTFIFFKTLKKEQQKVDEEAKRAGQVCDELKTEEN